MRKGWVCFGLRVRGVMAKTAPARPEVKPLDFLDIDHLLLDEERMIRDTVRQFVRDRVLPGIEDWFEAGHFPKEVAPEIGKLGLLGMHLHGYGCLGASATSYGIACLELEAGDSGFRSFVSVQGSLAMFPIWKYGSEEQKAGVAAPDGGRRGDRLLRADRARLRLRPRLDAHLRAPRRLRLGPQRQQALDHQRRHRRPRRGLGARPRRDPRLHRPPRRQGLHDPRHPQEALAPGVGDIGADPGGRPPAGLGGPSPRHRA